MNLKILWKAWYRFFYFRKKKKDVSSEEEEGEVKEDELHPLVSVTKINPDEIPDIPSNKFLMRGDGKTSDKDKKNKGIT